MNYRSEAKDSVYEELAGESQPDLTPILCARGGETTRDRCQSCWVDGAAVHRGPGVGCDLGDFRRAQSAREFHRDVWRVREVKRKAGEGKEPLVPRRARGRRDAIADTLKRLDRSGSTATAKVVLQASKCGDDGNAYTALREVAAKLGLGHVIVNDYLGMVSA